MKQYIPLPGWGGVRGWGERFPSLDGEGVKGWGDMFPSLDGVGGKGGVSCSPRPYAGEGKGVRGRT